MQRQKAAMEISPRDSLFERGQETLRLRLRKFNLKLSLLPAAAHLF